MVYQNQVWEGKSLKNHYMHVYMKDQLLNVEVSTLMASDFELHALCHIKERLLHAY